AIRPDMHIDPRLRYIDADKAIGRGFDIHHPASSMRARAQTTVRVHGMPAGATRSLTASKTRTHSGYRPGSVSRGSSTHQAMPREGGDMRGGGRKGNWGRLLGPMRRLFITALAGASMLAVNDLPQGRAEIRMPQVELLEATVPELQAVLTAGTVTSRDLV